VEVNSGLSKTVLPRGGVENQQTSCGAPGITFAAVRFIFSSSAMRFDLVCRRPAVSTMTHPLNALWPRNRVVDYGRRIGADFCLMTSMRYAAPRFQLLDRSGAKRVRGAEHHAASLLAKPVASFPMLVVLPAPLTPTMKITRVPLPFCEVEMPLPAATSGRRGAFRIE